MVKDPFYSMMEIFNFVASSQIQFPNLIDTKLDLYTSGPTAREFESLEHLKYVKVILYGHIQKTKYILESVKNAQLSSRPKDTTESMSVLMSIWGSQRAVVQAQRVGKPTFLVFIFVPLSFTTCLLGINVN